MVTQDNLLHWYILTYRYMSCKKKLNFLSLMTYLEHHIILDVAFNFATYTDANSELEFRFDVTDVSLLCTLLSVPDIIMSEEGGYMQKHHWGPKGLLPKLSLDGTKVGVWPPSPRKSGAEEKFAEETLPVMLRESGLLEYFDEQENIFERRYVDGDFVYGDCKYIVSEYKGNMLNTVNGPTLFQSPNSLLSH
ncbi:hypothetical protein PHMEG_00028320 [Phytophthora megakarya]|uniref:Uncharacterized protein n=1 Tax=Phytophthora megakarya TaxID=4795 RepID=A0A225V7R7_9STRA|nr:hypothetical protein PHMEG_00028320 [Phytophthora megakarya]